MHWRQFHIELRWESRSQLDFTADGLMGHVVELSTRCAREWAVTGLGLFTAQPFRFNRILLISISVIDFQIREDCGGSFVPHI